MNKVKTVSRRNIDPTMRAVQWKFNSTTEKFTQGLDAASILGEHLRVKVSRKNQNQFTVSTFPLTNLNDQNAIKAVAPHITQNLCGAVISNS
jgi:hypothetical protein